MKKSVAAASFLGIALAQTSSPIDPLQFLAEDDSLYSYSFGLSYIPLGEQNINLSEDGLYSFTRVSQVASLNAEGVYNLSPTFSLGLQVGPQLVFSDEERTELESGELSRVSDTSSDWNGVFTVRYRPENLGEIVPRISAGVSYPWGVVVEGSGAYVMDPVALSAKVGYKQDLEEDRDEQAFFVGAGVGFVANDKISFSLASTYQVPLDLTGIPAVGLELRTGYSPEPGVPQSLGIVTNLTASGGNTLIGLGLEWRGQDH